MLKTRPPRAVRSDLFSYWQGRLRNDQRRRIEEALRTLELRLPHLHRALVDAHLHGHRDVDWLEEEEAVRVLASMLAEPKR